MTDPDEVLRRAGDAARASLERLEVFAELESTNTFLLRQAPPPEGLFRAVIAEHQAAGRGRAGKRWLSPPSAGLCLSLGHTFARAPRDLACLTLAAGVAIAEVLEDLGAGEILLKWPNDLVAHGGKLGGILTEVHPGARAARAVVVGVGLNLDLPQAVRRSLESSRCAKVTDLAECLGAAPERNGLAAVVITSLVDAMRRFGSEGFGVFRPAWQGRDWLRGKDVSVEQHAAIVSGVAEGIDSGGALLVRTSSGIARIISGSVEVPGRGAACA